MDVPLTTYGQGTVQIQNGTHKMHSKISNRIYRYYFRYLGLTCYSSNKCIEIFLMGFILITVFLEVSLYYEYYSVVLDFIGGKNSNAIVYVNMFLDFVYKVLHLTISLWVIWKRHIEHEILQILQDIQDEFQLRLYHQVTEQQEREKYNIYYRYYWIFDICWILAFIGYCYQPGFMIKFLIGLMYSLQAIRPVYMQFTLYVIEIEQKLEMLETFIAINLYNMTEHNHLCQSEVITKLHKNTKSEGNCIHSAILNESFVVPLDFNEACDRSSPVTTDPLPSPPPPPTSQQIPRFRPFLQHRILTMKRIYEMISSVCQRCSSLYGLSVFLTNFLCVCDVAEIGYIVVTTSGSNKPAVLEAIFVAMPAVTMFALMCRMCDRCSRRTSSILLKLRSSPMKSFLVDDFILQIMQNPIKFSAYNFYDLNTQTLTKVFVIVFDLMLFLLQIYWLTQKA